MRAVLIYENTPAKASEAPQYWPSSSKLSRPRDRYALVMLAHPNCPCTRASLAELEIIVAKSQGKVAAFVLFSKPGASVSEIHESPLWRKATEIPDVLAVYNDRGMESRQFNGVVSGQTDALRPGRTPCFHWRHYERSRASRR